MFKPMVEELNPRITPCVVSPEPPVGPWACDLCETCVEDGCFAQIASGALDAANEGIARAYTVAWELGEEGYTVDTSEWEPEAPPVNPYVAQFEALTDAQLLDKVKELNERANALLARVKVMEGRDYSGVIGAVYAASDAIECAYIVPSLDNIKRQVEALLIVKAGRP